MLYGYYRFIIITSYLSEIDYRNKNKHLTKLDVYFGIYCNYH